MKIDNRDFKALKEQMEALIPFYTPEWNFSLKEMDAGSALVMVFLHMFEGVINRFNQVPHKNFIEFLNVAGIKLNPAQSFHVPLTFRLAQGASEPVMVSAGTQVGAYPEASRELILFETQKALMVTPAKISAAFNVFVQGDRITKVPDSLFNSGPNVSENPQEAAPYALRLFETSGENLQKHIFYIAQEDLLNLQSRVEIFLEIKNNQKHHMESALISELSGDNRCTWQFWGIVNGVEEWHDIKAYSHQEGLVLHKDALGQISLKEINGIHNRWLRCILNSPHIEAFNRFKVNEVNMNIRLCDSGQGKDKLYPDMLFYNDIMLLESEFYPFGEKFNLYDTFYLASREAFSKKGAVITLYLDFLIKEVKMVNPHEEPRKWKLIMKKNDFIEKQPLKTFIKKVCWEYWNGTGWIGLPVDLGGEDIFSGEPGKKVITFHCPRDLQESFVNNQENFWIRARLITIENLFSPDFIFLSPWVNRMRIHYSVPAPQRVNSVITYNNMEFRHFNGHSVEDETLFSLFYTLNQRGPSLYLGFDVPPAKGPLSLYFSLGDRKIAKDESVHARWEYLRAYGNKTSWEELKVTDGTENLTQSGMVVFYGPADYARAVLFEKDLYWIRITDTHTGPMPYKKFLPEMKGIFMNTTLALETQTIQHGLLEKMDGPGLNQYRLDRCPVLEEEVWIREEEEMDEEEIKKLKADGYQVDIKRALAGEIDEVWVRWKPVDNLWSSEASDRHYTLDAAYGIIAFGNGIHGMKPPYIGDASIIVKYRTGVGDTGILKAFEISHLMNAISYIDEVFNPEPYMGGCPNETVEKAMERGPEAIVHKDRAITPEDFEWLAMEACRSVTKVKCLSNYNDKGQKEPGWVTLVISNVKKGVFMRPNGKTCEKIYDYISQRSSDNLVKSSRFLVIEPLYAELSLEVTLTVSDTNMAYRTEEEVLSLLNLFLDPVEGNFESRGWEIGQLPHISMFYALIKSVENVDSVEKISILYRLMKENEFREAAPDLLTSLPHVLVTNGKHNIIIA
ncbi:MAG: hypothetical protein N2645_06120 [Clostridia bacterium]|nr:hypothetical protein [Clostridia bacterium]